MEVHDLIEIARTASNFVLIALQTWTLFKKKGESTKKRRKH